MQAVVHTHYLIADDAAVAYVLVAKAGGPVTTVFRQAVAQHDYIFAADGWFVHELEKTFVIMVRICARSGIQRGCHCVGYQ